MRRSNRLGGALALILAISGCAGSGVIDEGDDGDPTELATVGDTYHLVRQGSAKCLDVNGAGTTDGTNIHQWSCNGSAAQHFRFDSLAGGAIRLVNPHANKCVDVNGAGTADGTNIQLWTCNGSAAQAFVVEELGGGYSRLRNPHSGKCVDVNGAASADGTNVQLFGCNGSSAQSWQLVDESTGGGDPGGGDPGACQLVWSPDANADGLAAFEGQEMPEMWGTHTGVKHAYVVSDRDAYRIDQHYQPPAPIDYYGSTSADRMRCEVKGARTPNGTTITMKQGETWRIAWQLYIPSSLKATTSFTHIHQMKYIDTNGGSSGAPVITMSLHRINGVEKIALRLTTSMSEWSAVDLAPHHDRWLDHVEELTLGAGEAGAIKWTLKDGDVTVVNATKSGIDLWPQDAVRMRAKWGIYRSLNDSSGSLSTTYILFRNFKIYRCP
jgi:hypothetical protein